MGAARAAFERSWMEMHGSGRVGDRTPRGGAFDFGFRRLRRSVQSTLRSSGNDRLGRRPAQNLGRAGTPAERVADRPLAASPAAAAMAGGDRLAFVALLRGADEEPQRNCSQQAEAGNVEFSRLCFRLHRAVWAALYGGVDLGQTPRNDGRRAAAIDRENPRNQPENQAHSGGSGVFHRRSDRLFSRGRIAFPDAGDVSRTPAQERRETARLAMDQAAVGGLVRPCHEVWRETEARHFGVRELPSLSGSQNAKTKMPENAFRRVARPRQSDANPRVVQEAVRHRNQFPANATSPHLHLHAQPAFAAVLPGDRLDAAERMGLDTSDPPCGRNRSENNPAPRMSSIQTHAGLDRSRNRRPNAQRHNTLRHLATMKRTWNY